MVDEQGREVSKRGFRRYGETTCTYGQTVRVYESSTARGPHAWLQIQPGKHLKIDEVDGSIFAHLNEDQAREVIRLLQTFLDEVPEKWGEEEP